MTLFVVVFGKDKFIIKKFLDINKKCYYDLIIDNTYDRACQKLSRKRLNLRYKKFGEKSRTYILYSNEIL